MSQLPMGDIGPCSVTWDYGGTPYYINPYLGTVTLSMEDKISDVQEEAHGDMPVDAVFAGSVMELEIPMARNTLSELANSMGYGNMGSLVGNVLTLYNMTECEMYENAKEIMIKPVCNNIDDDDPHSWIHLFKCHPYRDIELVYDLNAQRIHMMEFKIFPNTDSGYCGEYGEAGQTSWRVCYKDDFDNGAIGGEWTTHKTDANRTIVEAGDVVTISIASNIDARWTWSVNEAPKLYQNVPAVPFESIIRLNSFTLNNHMMAGMWIGYYDAILGGNEAWKLILYRSDGTGEGIRTLKVPSGGGDWDFTVSSADLPLWMKIAVDASEVVTFYYSKDGSTWTQMKNVGVPMEISGWFASDMQIGILCDTGNTVHSGIAAPFDYFETWAYC